MYSLPALLKFIICSFYKPVNDGQLHTHRPFLRSYGPNQHTYKMGLPFFLLI